MGMQGPLTAQALGRSPYDEVVNGDGPEDPRQTNQQYDQRGRPINPETKRMNRDIIRAHNEVMLVIGVAEPENPFAGPEADSQRRHESYEESTGLRLGDSARQSVEAVGIFGIHGLRQRILIYKRYSQIPFWGLFKQSQSNVSVWAGAPSSWLVHYTEQIVAPLWSHDRNMQFPLRIVQKVWPYVKVHLELYVALQRLGIISSSMWFPHPSFFIPFTEASPIPAPPLPLDYTVPSLFAWLGGALVSSAPFLAWVMTQRMIRDWRPAVWSQIYRRLPNTVFHRKRLPPPPPIPPPPPPPPPPPTLSTTYLDPAEAVDPNDDGRTSTGNNEATGVGPAEGAIGADQASTSPPTEHSRRPSGLSARGDDYPSDDEDHDGVSATLISFDVEASESQDAPSGLWSAELRPSAGPDSRSGHGGNQEPVYMDTLLTHLPALIASHLFADSLTRIIMAPYEATALRLVARMFRARAGLPSSDIVDANFLSGLTATSLINFFGTELLHVTLASECWAIFSFLSQWFHMTEEEWKAEDGKA
ncbi:uncharacterized protein UV8b_06696 [Ustilaginoidea virens]|uniref:Uncharacterized protein n=1 Tax=Ustilaginoidea virens TaxID=1159556 RepID=A0A8E5HW28_USTVR|nr:uncharacterized protein UV8b_06696 [Ustilaginoidea virens]QUC22455.1 hypothetical protein UV8b_06696 [Ustilaginoidea virens]